MTRRARVAVLCAGLLLQRTAGAQTTAFDVASVKPSGTSDATPFDTLPHVMPISGGRFTAVNIPLRMLVGAAYEVEDARIVGGPSSTSPTAATSSGDAEIGRAHV